MVRSVVKGQGLEAPLPQAAPVLEIVPLAEKVAQPAVPPAEETMRSVVEAVPATVRSALGFTVPIPTRPLVLMVSAEAEEVA